jgi:hypothetical protein
LAPWRERAFDAMQRGEQVARAFVQRVRGAVGSMRRPSLWNSGTPSASDNLRRWPDTVGCAMCSASDARVTEPSRITASKAASCGIRPCRR